MGLQIKESLRSLCCRNGWSYAVVWLAKCHDSMLLISGDAYHEEQIGMLANKMLHQVHVVGEGIIGQVASTGKHRWIFSDTYFGVSSPEGLVDNQAAFQDTAEWYHQFMAGIKTIAVISVSPQSVVQFGSTQKIPEKLEFVDHVKSLFQQLQSVPGPSLLGNAWKPVNRQTNDLNGTFASLLLSSNSYFNQANIKPMHDSICKEMMVKALSSNHVQPLNPLNSGLHHGCPQPHALAIPEISSSICAINDSNGLHQKTATFTNNSSFHLKNGFRTEGAEAQVLFSSSNMQLPQVLQSNSSSANSPLLNNTSMSTWGNKASALTSTEQQLPPATGIGSRNTFLTNLHPNVSCGNTFANFHRNPSLPPLYITNGSVDGITNAMVNREYGVQELVDSQHRSPLFHDAKGKQSTSKSYSSATPLVPQLPREPASRQSFLGNIRPMNPTSALSKPNTVSNLNQWMVPLLEPVKNGLPTPLSGGLLQAVGGAPISSGFIEGDVLRGIPISDVLRPVQNPTACGINSHSAVSDARENSMGGPMQLDNDLFDCLGLDLKQNQGMECWDDFMLPEQCGNHSDLMTSVSECLSELDAGSMNGSGKGLFSDLGLEQLLDAVVGNAGSISNHNSDDQSSTTTITRAGSMSVYSNQVPLAGLSCLSESTGLLPKSNSEKTTHGCQKEAPSTSLISSWIDSSYNINTESAVVSQLKRVEEPPKVTRKRARPGESTRPRPKDRQQIQDRVKELREIVPNGAKCSIDSLLDRTIKHMLFLQSVTKYAKKLKEVDEPKMIGKESGVVLKDNSSGSGGGATWAFEVGGQTMVCPIVVEDLNPPGQMLVEMLCEERGFFLEIADIIRGFGLTILKGVMEVRDSKIWARFVVEANREITRMDIFLSLVQLLQQTSISSSGQPTAAPDGGVPVFSNYQKSPMPLPISLADRIQ